jgi:hypothetical protein
MRRFHFKPRLKYPVIGQARDVLGRLWHVRDSRTTKHGFDLLFGSPDDANRRYWGIITPKEYTESTNKIPTTTLGRVLIEDHMLRRSQDVA